MRIVGISVLFILLLAGLCVYVVQVVPVQIETSIRTDIEQQFALNDLSKIDVSVDGRDVSLSGKVETQNKINQAMKLASSRAGVRVVMTSVSVSADESATNQQPQQQVSPSVVVDQP